MSLCAYHVPGLINALYTLADLVFMTTLRTLKASLNYYGALAGYLWAPLFLDLYPTKQFHFQEYTIEKCFPHTNWETHKISHKSMVSPGNY